MSKKKGDRTERLAQSALEGAGFKVERPNYSRYGNKDFFNLFDIMALRPDRKIHFIQVKTNSPGNLTKFHEEISFVPSEHARIEYWIRYDRQGWRVLLFDEDGYEEIYDSRDSSINIDKGIEQFKTR